MPIGSTLTNDVPAVGSSGTGYATAVNALLEEMKTAIEGTVPFSALSGSTLDMNNVPIIDAAYVAFYNTTGTPSAALAGRFVYSDGEMWAVNSTGAIQITSGGALNASGIGGIAGDYGGANPASVRFVDAATRYDFYDDYSTLTWAYTRARGLDIAAGATSTVYAQLRYGGAGTLTFTLPPTLPGSGRSAVVINASGAILHNDGTNTVENDIYMASGKWVKTPGRKLLFVPSTFRDRLASGSWAEYIPGVYPTGVTITNGTADVQLSLTVGMELTGINVRANKAIAANASWILVRIADGTTTTVKTGAGIGGTGWVDITDSFTHTVLDGNVYILRLVSSAGGDTTFTSISVSYTG